MLQKLKVVVSTWLDHSVLTAMPRPLLLWLPLRSNRCPAAAFAKLISDALLCFAPASKPAPPVFYGGPACNALALTLSLADFNSVECLFSCVASNCRCASDGETRINLRYLVGRLTSLFALVCEPKGRHT